MNEQNTYTVTPVGNGTINHMDSSEQHGNTLVIEKMQQPTVEKQAGTDVANILAWNEIKRQQQNESKQDLLPHTKIVEELNNTKPAEPDDKGVQDLIKETKGLDKSKPFDRKKLFDLIKAIFAVKKIMVEYKKTIKNISDLDERLNQARKTIRHITDVLKKHGFTEALVDKLAGNLEKMAEETAGLASPNQDTDENMTTDEEIAVEPLPENAPMHQRVYKAYVRGLLAENDGEDPESYPGSLQNRSEWSDQQLVEAYKQIGTWIDVNPQSKRVTNQENALSQVHLPYDTLQYIRYELERRNADTTVLDQLGPTIIEDLGVGAANLPPTPAVPVITINPNTINDQGLKNQIRLLQGRGPQLSISDLDQALRDVFNKMKSTTPQTPQEIADQTKLEEIANNLETARRNLLTAQTEEQRKSESRMSREEYEFREMVGKSIDEKDFPYFFLDARIRDEVLNDILAAADAQPAEGFREVMSPFNAPGRRLEHFRKFVSNAQIAVNRFPDFIKWKDANNVDIRDERKIAGFEDIKRDYPRILEEIEVRGIIHDLNGVMYRPSLKLEDIAKFAQSLDSGYGDIAFRIEGVKEMKNIIEMVIRQVMAENGGYLPPAAMTGSTKNESVPLIDEYGKPIPEDPNDPNSKPKTKDIRTTLTRGKVEDIARERFKELYRKGQIFKWNEETGKPLIAEARELKDWEVGRIFVLARGLMIADGRMLTLAAESKIPPGGLYTSLFLQDILQGVSGFIHLLAKYQVTEDHLAVLLQPGAFVKKNDLIDAYEAYIEDPGKFIEGFPLSKNKFIRKFAGHFYINQQNATRAGDIYSYQGWRYNPNRGGKAETVSAVRRFMEMGREHMLQRYLEKKYSIQRTDLTKREPIEQYLPYKQYLYTDLHGEDLANQTITLSDVIIVNAFLKIPQNQRPPIHEIGTFMKDANIEEYANWIGNAMRLERLRGSLESKNKDSIATAKTILGQIVCMQPHRLFTISRKLQVRMENEGTHKYSASDNKTQDILQNLSIVEQMFWQSREEFLDKGDMFGKIDFIAKIKDPNYWFTKKLTAKVKYKNTQGNEIEKDVFTQQEIDEMYEFAMKIRKLYGFENQYASTTDDQTPGAVVSKREALYDEFIYSRNYTHGFGLWALEDPTILHLADNGPSAGFARRYRDMENSAKAYGEIITLLGGIGHYQQPEQIMEQLDKIYLAVSNYDSGKAKQMMADLIPGVAMFYSSSGITAVPGVGNLWNLLPGRQGNKMLSGTFAEFAYGPQTMKWGAVQRNFFTTQIRRRNWLTQDQLKEVNKLLKSTNTRAFAVGATFIAELASLVFLLYLISEGIKEK